jgi:hypothetical protein
MAQFNKVELRRIDEKPKRATTKTGNEEEKRAE